LNKSIEDTWDVRYSEEDSGVGEVCIGEEVENMSSNRKSGEEAADIQISDAGKPIKSLSRQRRFPYCCDETATFACMLSERTRREREDQQDDFAVTKTYAPQTMALLLADVIGENNSKLQALLSDLFCPRLFLAAAAMLCGCELAPPMMTGGRGKILSPRLAGESSTHSSYLW
jgi:hypothetical protein